MNWKKDQEFEKEWWGDCVNTLGEEVKQIKYAELMGLKFFHNGKSPYNIDAENKTILDIGGGAVSLLLKCTNLKQGIVLDPCNYPDWIINRYFLKNIIFIKSPAEDSLSLIRTFPKIDEVWIYNVLQHVENVEKVTKNAKSVSKIIRIFEWIDTGISIGHPNNLTEELLNNLLNGYGKVVRLHEPQLKGKTYSGIFKGDLFNA